jgi:hypothetical protein
MSHEAKPHLPGAVLMLITVLAAIRYVDTGKARWWLITGGLCGAAVGMVLTSWPIFAVLPIMVMLQPLNRRQRLNIMAGSAVAGVLFYFVTNPYVLINLFANRELLASNLFNTAAMFEIGSLGQGIGNAVSLIAGGAGPFVAVAGVIGSIVCLICARRNRPSNVAWLLAAPAMLVLLQFTAAAAGEPGEYGRFAILVDIALAVVAAMVAAAWRFGYREAFWGLCVMTTLPGTYWYLSGFVRDCESTTSRTRVAEALHELSSPGGSSLAVLAEPAPYIMPPVNLFEYRILLMPEDPEVMIAQMNADLILAVFDEDSVAAFDSYQLVYHRWERGYWTRISWANKMFMVFQRKVPVDETRLQP